MDYKRPIQTDMPQQIVELPWAAWFQDTVHPLCFPSSFSVDVLQPPATDACHQNQIDKALDAPVDAARIEQLCRSSDRVCIVVDDLARPTRMAGVLASVLRRLHDVGIEPSRITIVIATGTHALLTEQQVRWKVGDEIADRYTVKSHDAESTVATGIAYGKETLKINQTFLQADFKIGITTILPHSFAGFSGGAKIVLPGLADVTATARSHRYVQMGLRGGHDVNQNGFRRETERLVRQLGMNVAVCVVPNHQREIARIVYGDLVSAHRKACRLAGDIFTTQVSKTYDCMVLNAYPKDTDLVQAEGSFVALKHLKQPLLREEGVYVITTAASEGIGHHGLFAPGGASYRTPRQIRRIGDRDLWVYAPGLSDDEIHSLYWTGYACFSDAESLCRALSTRFDNEADVGILPYAPMQQVVDRREQ